MKVDIKINIFLFVRMEDIWFESKSAVGAVKSTLKRKKKSIISLHFFKKK